MNYNIDPLEPAISCFIDLSDEFKEILLEAFNEKQNKIAIGANLKNFCSLKK